MQKWSNSSNKSIILNVKWLFEGHKILYFTKKKIFLKLVATEQFFLIFENRSYLYWVLKKIILNWWLTIIASYCNCFSQGEAPKNSGIYSRLFNCTWGFVFSSPDAFLGIICCWVIILKVLSHQHIARKYFDFS